MTTHEKYEELHSAYCNDKLPDSVTSWEVTFIEDNEEKLQDIDPYFSEKQSEVIDRIYSKLDR
jgi:hypothetical protein